MRTGRQQGIARASEIELRFRIDDVCPLERLGEVRAEFAQKRVAMGELPRQLLPRNGTRLRRGVFTRVPELISAIDEYIAHHNTNPKPFIWTKSARDILPRVIRANSRLSSKQNEALH